MASWAAAPSESAKCLPDFVQFFLRQRGRRFRFKQQQAVLQRRTLFARRRLPNYDLLILTGRRQCAAVRLASSRTRPNGVRMAARQVAFSSPSGSVQSRTSPGIGFVELPLTEASVLPSGEKFKDNTPRLWPRSTASYRAFVRVPQIDSPVPTAGRDGLLAVRQKSPAGSIGDAALVASFSVRLFSCRFPRPRRAPWRPGWPKPTTSRRERRRGNGPSRCVRGEPMRFDAFDPGPRE